MFLLFCSLILIDILGIDMGSQYLKLAESTISGEPKAIRDSENLASFPSAVATKKNIDTSALPEKLLDFPVLFGSRALKILKTRPQNGIEFLPRVIGRSKNNQFYTSKNLTSEQLLGLYMRDLVSKYGKTHVVFPAVPFYWTEYQKFSLGHLLNTMKIRSEIVLDDTEAIAAHYGSIRYTRYQKASRNVLFVDIGATSCEVYAITFQWDRKQQFSMANETASRWSESIGSYFFAKPIVEKEKISYKKAYKKLQQSETFEKYANTYSDQIERLKEMINDVAVRAHEYLSKAKADKNSLFIDEVQLIGSGTKMPFVRELVKEAANCSNIMRDFNINEEISLGIVYSIQSHKGISKSPPVVFSKISPYTISMKCEDTSVFCEKQKSCNFNVTFENFGCDQLTLKAKDDEIPEGTQAELFTADLLNISDMNYSRGDKARGDVIMSSQTIFHNIENIQWCKEETCYPINFEIKHNEKSEIDDGMDFIRAYISGIQEKKFREKLISDIYQYLDNFNIDDFYSISPDIRWELEPIKAAVDMGTINSYTIDELKETCRHLRKLVVNQVKGAKLPEPIRESDYSTEL